MSDPSQLSDADGDAYLRGLMSGIADEAPSSQLPIVEIHSRVRRIRRRRTAAWALAAGTSAVVVVAAVAVPLMTSSQHGAGIDTVIPAGPTRSLLAPPGSVHETAPSVVSAPAPATVSAPAHPAVRPSTAVSPATRPTSARPSSLASASASAPPSLSCQGTPKPCGRSQPECDLLHPQYTQPPESDCVTPVNACAWPDSWGATPAGMQSVTHTETADSISVSWVGEFLAGNQFMDPVHSYVVGLFQGSEHTILREIPLPLSQTSYTFSGLAPGEYEVGIAEISDAGRSPYDGPMWLVLPPTAPSPGPATAAPQ